MKTPTKFGTFEELLAGTTEDISAICAALKKTIYKIHPDAVEVVRLGDNAASQVKNDK